MTRPRLGLDTASPFLALALWWPDGDLVARADHRLDRRLAAELVPRVDAFLAQHGVAPRDLAGVGVGVGPGSYTGARVGVAWAVAVGRALDLPVVGGDTLAARALACVAPGEAGWVAVEARRGQAWLQRWGWSNGALGALDEPRQVGLGELPSGASLSLQRAPDALWHARRVDAPGAGPPRVTYGPAPATGGP